MGHAVLEQGYVPRVIMLCLDLVVLAETRPKHIGGCWLEEKTCANKSSFNFFQLISSFFFLVLGGTLVNSLPQSRKAPTHNIHESNLQTCGACCNTVRILENSAFKTQVYGLPNYQN